MSDTIAYKILHPTDLETLQRDGRFQGSAVDLKDGFIHLSTAAQVDETLGRHFANVPDVWIVAVDLAGLRDKMRWEPSRGGALFPHLYADLPLHAVVALGPPTRTQDGTLQLPTPTNAGS